MKNSDNPLRLNVGYLFNKPIGTSRDVPIELENVQIEDLEVRDLKSLIRISRTREGLLLEVTVKAEIKAECGRCLESFFQEVEAKFEELYQFPSRRREQTDLILPSDGYIDLAPLYREYLLLAIPIKSVCSPDCKGLCVVCGANLNKTTCEHQQTDDDSSVIMEDGESV